MMFYELRVIMAIIVLFISAYEFRWFDDILKWYMVDDLKRKFKLPIEIDSVRIDIYRGTLDIK